MLRVFRLTEDLPAIRQYLIPNLGKNSAELDSYERTVRPEKNLREVPAENIRSRTSHM